MITTPPQKLEADLPPKTLEVNSQVGQDSSLKGNQVEVMDESKAADDQPLCQQTQVKHVKS